MNTPESGFSNYGNGMIYRELDYPEPDEIQEEIKDCPRCECENYHGYCRTCGFPGKPIDEE